MIDNGQYTGLEVLENMDLDEYGVEGNGEDPEELIIENRRNINDNGGHVHIRRFEIQLTDEQRQQLFERVNPLSYDDLDGIRLVLETIHLLNYMINQ
jgi:phenylpyruvate tautomerase PptA (4-oxalocrotonate tautomerase family)